MDLGSSILSKRRQTPQTFDSYVGGDGSIGEAVELIANEFKKLLLPAELPSDY